MKNIFKKTIAKIIEIEARLILLKYKPKIIAVTGNVGKTSTKDAIFTVLAKYFYVRKSEKSFNSDIGVPLTILGQPNGWSNPIQWLKNILEGIYQIVFTINYPKILVLEVGADRPGDIKSITEWLKPDVVVLTKMSKVPVHIEYFASQAEFLKEKGYLVSALKKEGFLIINMDDEDIFSLKSLSRAETFTYGVTSNANYKASEYEIEYDGMQMPLGIRFRIDSLGNSVPIRISNTLGAQNLYAITAAVAVGDQLGVNMVNMADALTTHETPRGRMKLIPGIKNSLIIDDTYNSSPTAVKEALNTLKMIETKNKKIAMLGDMLELGKYSSDEHKKIGNLVTTSADYLATVGVRAEYIAEGALNSGMSEKNIRQYEDSRVAGKDTETIIGVGDIILVKGSQSIRMEKTVEEIMAFPDEKEKVLVRQEEEWMRR